MGRKEKSSGKSVVEKRVYLFTGGPGTGKTTVAKRAIARIGGKAGGFYTEEIRAHGAREGFRIITLDGQSAILAHINITSAYRVSKYGVDIDSLNAVGVNALRRATRECDLVVVDEIGKMELFSPQFCDAVWAAIESKKKVLGTIMLAAHPWADKIKHHPEVTVVTVTRANREQVLTEVLRWLGSSEVV